MAFGHRRKISRISYNHSRNFEDTDSQASPRTSNPRTIKRHVSNLLSSPKASSRSSLIASSRDLGTYLPLTKRRSEPLDIFCWGTGSMCELGLGPECSSKTVMRPRLNHFLTIEKAQIVDLAVGGMHAAAIDSKGRILTWGVNDQGALGRSTQWTGSESDSEEDIDDEEQKLNPFESTPGFVTGLPHDFEAVKAACSDSSTFVIDLKGDVYSWGTFRCSDGILGYLPHEIVATNPRKVAGLSNVISLACGVDHVLALTSMGRVFSWGNGQQYQLGRRVVERTRKNGLIPREFGLKDIKIIGAGSYHSFAIDKDGTVFSWGLNQFGQCGIPSNGGEDGAVVPTPTPIPAFANIKLIQISGGEHHSCAITEHGELYVWGRLDMGQLGISMCSLPPTVQYDTAGNPRFIPTPFKLNNLPLVSFIAAGTHHNIAISKLDGSLWSWGYGESYQTGQGAPGNDIEIPTKITNTATRDVRMMVAGAGGQFSVAGGLQPIVPNSL